MKKIIVVIALLLGAGFTATAQQKTVAKQVAAQPQQGTQAAFHEAAVKDLNTLKSIVKLDANQEQSMMGLFMYKHQYLAMDNLSAQRKDGIYESIDAKLRASLSAEDMAKLDAKPEVLKQLTH